MFTISKDFLFFVWGFAVCIQTFVTFFCVLLHLSLPQSVADFKHFATASSILLLAENLTACYCVFLFEPYFMSYDELIIRTIGRVCAATGMAIWAYFLSSTK